MYFGSNYQGLANHWNIHSDTSHCYGYRMFSEGTTMYSYGHHYVLARKVVNSTGRLAIIINANDYSKTTAKQKQAIINATKRNLQLQLPNATISPSVNISYFIERIRHYCNKALRARTIDYSYYIKYYYLQLEVYLDFFRTDRRRIDPLAKKILKISKYNTRQLVELLCDMPKVEKKVEPKKVKKKVKKNLPPISLNDWLEVLNKN